jgi:MFS transporter, DHA2 family, multidrug resistance protein
MTEPQLWPGRPLRALPGALWRSKWIGYLAMCLGMFMAILDIQIVASSLPDIQAGLRIPLDLLSWIQIAYLTAEIVAIPLTGWLTRLLSLRMLFLIAVSGFTAASAGCAASSSFAGLIAFRVLQGFTGGILIPAVFTAVFMLFPERLHVRATAIAGVIAMLATTLGPVFGGYITETYDWPWLFLINLGPGAVAALVAGMALRTEAPDRTAMGRLDYASLVLLAVALASLQLALKDAPERGWSDPRVLATFALSLVTGFVGVHRCLQQVRPLVTFRVLREPDFAASCFYSFVLGGGVFGSVYLLPLFLGYVHDYQPLTIGMYMTVTGVTQLVSAPVAASLERRVDTRILTGIGYGAFGVGLLANGFCTHETDFWGLFGQQVLRGGAAMLCLLPTTAAALEGRVGEELADASALFNLLRNLGGAVWIALIDTIIEIEKPIHAGRIVDRLYAGDPDMARAIGVPASELYRFHHVPITNVDEATKELVRPLVEHAVAAQCFNDAWRVLGIFFLLSLIALPLLRRRATAS